MKKILILLILSLISGGLNAIAQKFPVKVVGVTDGDTFTVVNKDNLQLKIRIWGIDAPEKGQDYGNKAKQVLSDYIYGKEIVIDVQSRDSWGRYISYVFTPEGKDISLIMLNEGMAWHFTKYDSTEEYHRAEEEARAKRIGLWSIADPIAPWDYRKN